jgi:hypothetical protein
MANEFTGVPPISQEAFDAMGTKEKKRWVPVTVEDEAKYIPKGFVLVTDENHRCFMQGVPTQVHFQGSTGCKKFKLLDD